MAFGFMNTRRYALLYSFLASLFMNCVSVYWTMWSVLTISLFMLTLTDFMFFQVHRGLWCPIGLGAGGEGRVARLSAAADSLLRAAPRPTVAHLPAVSLAGRLAFRPLCSPSLPDATLCSSRRTTSSGDPAWLRTLLACSLILPMRAASGGGFSSVLAARGREDTHRSLRYSFACSEAREGGGRVSEWDGGEREREIVPTPYLLILGGMYLQLSRRYGLHAWRSYFSLAVRFVRDQ